MEMCQSIGTAIGMQVRALVPGCGNPGRMPLCPMHVDWDDSRFESIPSVGHALLTSLFFYGLPQWFTVKKTYCDKCLSLLSLQLGKFTFF